MACRSFASGANRDRTGDLLLAKQALSQLSYGPFAGECRCRRARPRADVLRGSSLATVPCDASAVEVEVPRWALLKPQPVVLGRILQEVRRLFEHVLRLCGLRL